MRRGVIRPRLVICSTYLVFSLTEHVFFSPGHAFIRYGVFEATSVVPLILLEGYSRFCYLVRLASGMREYVMLQCVYLL